MKNEKGLTLIELLISLVILAAVMSGAALFYSDYSSKMKNMSHQHTAKNFAISALEIEMEKTELGDKNTDTIYSENIHLDGQLFSIKTEKKDITSSIVYYSPSIKFYRINSIATWDGKKIEVTGYVSSR